MGDEESDPLVKGRVAVRSNPALAGRAVQARRVRLAEVGPRFGLALAHSFQQDHGGAAHGAFSAQALGPSEVILTRGLPVGNEKLGWSLGSPRGQAE